MKKYALIAVCLSLLTLTSTLVFAKPVNLYDSPNAGAKNVGTIDLSAGVIPIYQPKGSDWVKVADPKNGNVGWIKSSDIKDANSSVTFTQKVMSDGKGESYQSFQFGTPPSPADEAKAKEAMQKMQIEQYDAQKTLQNVIQHMTDEIKAVQQQAGFVNPIIMPVVIMPAPQKPATTK